MNICYIKLHFHTHINHVFLTILSCWVYFVALPSPSHLLNICKDYVIMLDLRLNIHLFSGFNYVHYAKKMECIQQRFAALCFKCFFAQIHYCCSIDLEELKLQIFHTISPWWTLSYLGSKFCPSALEIVGLIIPAWNITCFALFNVCSCKNCPSPRYASAANVVYRDVHIFGIKNVLLNHIL